MKRLKNKNGFASFEFAWCSLVFAALIAGIFDLFSMLHLGHGTFLQARNRAFSSVWQVSTLPNTGIMDRKGLVYREEVMAAGACTGKCRDYVAMGDTQNYGFGIGSYTTPSQTVYLILDDGVSLNPNGDGTFDIELN